MGTNNKTRKRGLPEEDMLGSSYTRELARVTKGLSAAMLHLTKCLWQMFATGTDSFVGAHSTRKAKFVYDPQWQSSKLTTRIGPVSTSRSKTWKARPGP